MLLFLLAALIIYDGFTGPQLAPENIATVAAWLHYRGLVVLALLAVGNLFCLSCPFTLPRTIARRLSGRGWRWPRLLRNKWAAIFTFFLLLYLYEWLDLWASPWLTAWVAVAYFVAAFALEALFAASPFCKYVCPLGTFNFVGSTLSPLQITVADGERCRTCPGKECVNGSPAVLGCGTELFPPQMKSNLDCLLCFDCARACPYENVAWIVRSPLQEAKTPETWPARWDLGFLAFVFLFAGLSNAFGMVPPFYDLLAWVSRWWPAGQGLLLLLLFGALDLLLPLLAGLGGAVLARVLGAAGSLRAIFGHYAPAFVPQAFAVWIAHYGFHFATGALTIVPVLQSFLRDHGVTVLGAPNWALGNVLPFAWLLPLQILLTLAGATITFYALGDRARRRQDAALAQLPWYVLSLLMALVAIFLFSLPMEMRGTSFMN
jgi:hypothetical protein